MHAICKPSFVFNPESVDDIYSSMINAFNTYPNKSEQLVFNEIEGLISILN